MKINKEFFIEKSASKPNDCLLVLKTLELVQEKEGAFLIAMDGKQLAKVPVTLEEGDTLGKVSVEALKQARKSSPKSFSEATLALNGKQEVPNGPSYSRPTKESNGRFPDYQQVFPKGEGKMKISLDPKRLLELAQSLGTEHVTLEIYGDTSPIKVTGYKENAVGVLMPVKM